MTMVITVQCPSCATSFPVDPRKIPEKGVKVRCSFCSAIFRVERPAEAATPPPPPPVVEAPPEPVVVTPQEPAQPAYEAPPEPVASEPAPEPPPPPAAPEPVVDEPPHFGAPVVAAPPEPPVEAPPEPPVEAPVETAGETPAETPMEAPPRDPFADWRSETSTEPVEPAQEAAGDFYATSEAAADTASGDLSAAMDEAVEAVTETPPPVEESEEAAARAELARGPVDEWIMETEDDVGAGGLDVERLDTIDAAVEGGREDTTLTEVPGFRPIAQPEPELPPFDVPPFDVPPASAEEPEAREVPPFDTPMPSDVPSDAFAAPPAPPMPPQAPPVPEPPVVPELPPEPPAAPPPSLGSTPYVPEAPEAPVPPKVPEPAPPAAPSAPSAGGTTGVGAFTFGKRDPKDKARRLARVLVSDMIMYNPERHERALANGTLKEDFEDEIRKSWKEYVEQVGEEIAQGNDFWTDALNDVLAKGQRVF